MPSEQPRLAAPNRAIAAAEATLRPNPRLAGQTFTDVVARALERAR